MNNIPEGYKLVPVEPTEEMKKAIYGLLSAYDDGSDISPSFFMKMLINAAPTPPQPIYYEAKERELFAEWWRNTPILRVNKLQLAEAAWLACAQSRAKAGEDE